MAANPGNTVGNLDGSSSTHEATEPGMFSILEDSGKYLQGSSITMQSQPLPHPASRPDYDLAGNETHSQGVPQTAASLQVQGEGGCSSSSSEAHSGAQCGDRKSGVTTEDMQQQQHQHQPNSNQAMPTLVVGYNGLTEEDIRIFSQNWDTDEEDANTRQNQQAQHRSQLQAQQQHLRQQVQQQQQQRQQQQPSLQPQQVQASNQRSTMIYSDDDDDDDPDDSVDGSGVLRHMVPNDEPPVEFCVVCFDRPPDVTLDPCGHDNMCVVCVSNLLKRKCPTCRTKVKNARFEARSVVSSRPTATNTTTNNSTNYGDEDRFVLVRPLKDIIADRVARELICYEKTLQIVILGPSQCGKSQLLNSIKSIFHNDSNIQVPSCASAATFSPPVQRQQTPQRDSYSRNQHNQSQAPKSVETFGSTASAKLSAIFTNTSSLSSYFQSMQIRQDQQTQCHPPQPALTHPQSRAQQISPSPSQQQQHQQRQQQQQQQSQQPRSQSQSQPRTGLSMDRESFFNILSSAKKAAQSAAQSALASPGLGGSVGFDSSVFKKQNWMSPNNRNAKANTAQRITSGLDHSAPPLSNDPPPPPASMSADPLMYNSSGDNQIVDTMNGTGNDSYNDYNSNRPTSLKSGGSWGDFSTYSDTLKTNLPPEATASQPQDNRGQQQSLNQSPTTQPEHSTDLALPPPVDTVDMNSLYDSVSAIDTSDFDHVAINDNGSTNQRETEQQIDELSSQATIEYNHEDHAISANTQQKDLPDIPNDDGNHDANILYSTDTNATQDSMLFPVNFAPDGTLDQFSDKPQYSSSASQVQSASHGESVSHGDLNQLNSGDAFARNVIVNKTPVRFSVLGRTSLASKKMIIEDIKTFKPDVLLLCSSTHIEKSVDEMLQFDRILRLFGMNTVPRYWASLSLYEEDTNRRSQVQETLAKANKDISFGAKPKGIFFIPATDTPGKMEKTHAIVTMVRELVKEARLARGFDKPPPAPSVMENIYSSLVNWATSLNEL